MGGLQFYRPGLYFVSNAQRPFHRSALLLLWLLVVVALLFYLNWLWAICGLVVAALCFAYYRWLAYSKFGGINGDLAGWFLQLLELNWLLLVLLLQRLPQLM